jgi:hypothetical protein
MCHAPLKATTCDRLAPAETRRLERRRVDADCWPLEIEEPQVAFVEGRVATGVEIHFLCEPWIVGAQKRQNKIKDDSHRPRLETFGQRSQKQRDADCAVKIERNECGLENVDARQQADAQSRLDDHAIG